MRLRPPARRLLAVAGLVSLALAGCTTSGSSEGGSTLGNLFFYGGTTAPPVASAEPTIEVADCPPVTVTEGAAAIRSGEGAAVRNQVSIVDVARECRGRLDGSVVVKVGVRGRALLGPGGTAASFDAPVTFRITRGETVLATRTKRVAVAIPTGEVERSFAVVEDGFVVPPGEGEFEIEVAFGGGAREPAAARRRRGRS